MIKFTVSLRLIVTAAALVLAGVCWNTILGLLNSDSDIEFRIGCVGVMCLLVGMYHGFRKIWSFK